MWEILSRETPYKGMSQAEVAYKVLHFHERPNLAAIERTTPDALVDLVLACWEEEPARRPSFSEILSELKTLAGSV